MVRSRSPRRRSGGELIGCPRRPCRCCGKLGLEGESGPCPYQSDFTSSQTRGSVVQIAFSHMGRPFEVPTWSLAWTMSTAAVIVILLLTWDARQQIGTPRTVRSGSLRHVKRLVTGQ
eukprot:3543148-Amphidinium_carterae.2